MTPNPIQLLAQHYAQPMVYAGYIPQDSVTFKWTRLMEFVEAVILTHDFEIVEGEE